MQQKCRMTEMDELLKSEMTKIKGFLMDMRFAMFFLKFMLCLIGLQFLIGFDVSFYQYWRHFNHHLNMQTRGGVGVSFSIQKFILQIFDLYKGPSLDVFRKNCNIIFRKWGEGVKGRLEFRRKFIRFCSVTRPFSPYDFSPCWPRKGVWSVVRSGKETKSESSPTQLTALGETCWQKTTYPQTSLHLNNIKKKKTQLKQKLDSWTHRSTPHKDFEKRLTCSQGTAPWCSRVCLTSSLRLWPASFYQLSLSFNKISSFN